MSSVFWKGKLKMCIHKRENNKQGEKKGKNTKKKKQRKMEKIYGKNKQGKKQVEKWKIIIREK